MKFYITWQRPAAGRAAPWGLWCHSTRPSEGSDSWLGCPGTDGVTVLWARAADTIRGDRWFTMLLRSGCLWDVLIKSQITEQVSILNKWINKHSIFKPPREICKCKKGIFKEKDCVCHTAVWTHFSQIHFTQLTAERQTLELFTYFTTLKP